MAMKTIPFMKEATEITKDKIEQIIKENEQLGFGADHIGVTVTMELLRDVSSVIKGLQAENTILAENNTALDEQRTDFAKKICKQDLEIKRLKEQSRWIPVSERLPVFEYYGKRYWAYTQIKYPNGKIDKRIQLLYREQAIVRGKTVERWKTPWNSMVHDEVLAWMPLKVPEPPKEGE